LQEDDSPEAEAGWLLLGRLGILLDKTLSTAPPTPRGGPSRMRRRR